MRRRTRSVAIVAASVVLLTSCESSPTGLLDVRGVGAATTVGEPLPTDRDLADVVAAAHRTLRSRVFVTGTVELTGHGTRLALGPLPQSMRFAGPFDFGHSTGELTAGLTGEGVGTLTERFLPLRVLVSDLPGVRPGAWGVVLRKDLRTHDLYRSPANDPTHALQLVAGAEEMARTGVGVVDGTPAITYRGYLTTESLLAPMTSAVQAKARALLRLLGPQARRIAVWVSHSGLLLRVQFGFVARQGGDMVRELIQLDFARYGLPVRVVRPPAQAQTPVPELTGFLFG